MPQRIITDPTHPHGTPRGYWSGCNCDPCRESMRRRRNWLQIRKGEGVVLPTHRLDATAVRDHVRALLAADPSVTYSAIARAAGMSGNGVKNLAIGITTTMRHDKRSALLAVRVDHARAQRVRIPNTEVIPLVRQLQAAGYPQAWIINQGAITNTDLLYHAESWVHINQVRRLQDLHARYADVPATPETEGLSRHSIARARNVARRLGYWPVWHLDANGNVDPRSIREHPWSQLDEKAAVQLDIIRDVLGGTLSIHDVAEKWGMVERRVQRWLSRADLRISDPTSVQRVSALLADYDDGVADPVATALLIGVMSDYKTLGDHPGVLAYREQLALAADPSAAARAA